MKSVHWMLMVGLLFVAPGCVSTPDDHVDQDAKDLVSDAIYTYNYMDEAAFEQMSDVDGPYRDGSLYIFVLDMDGLIVAHAGDPSRVGNVALTEDGERMLIIDRILEGATVDGSWFIYDFLNPETNVIESKRSWAVLHDDYVFGAGLYGE